ncbi:MAG: cysteine desulfurase [Betaproteobacteria bacterium]|nr:cysteine desulfurase [Betaproteobacteria bacterium]
MDAMIYLDHNATTPIAPPVLEAMLPFLREQYGNASSRHDLGTVARRAVEQAREQVAAAVGVQPGQVVFTSGGTEANNLIVKGAAATRPPAQIVVSGIEHPCVLEPALQLRRQGWTVAEVGVDAEGVVRADTLAAALRVPTGIVSVMLANNETGAIQPVAALAEHARGAKAVMHTDAVQAFGKIPVRFADLNVQAMSLSSHKVYGPKGAGALIVDKRLDLQPLLAGGGHERGMRSGTENVAAIVGFGAAAELAMLVLDAERERLAPLQARLEAGLSQRGGRIFGAGAPRLANTTYFAFPDVEGETLVIQLDGAGFATASGAACSSHHSGPSRVLLAMGVEAALAGRAVRISLGRANDAAQIDTFLAALDEVLGRLQRLAAIAA